MLCARAGSSFFFWADWGVEPFGMANSGPGAGIGPTAANVVGTGGGGQQQQMWWVLVVVMQQQQMWWALVVVVATTATVVTVAVGTENIESCISFT